jgi:predicted CoA-binding protein
MRINDDTGLSRVMTDCKTIAVVGMSVNEDRPSNRVARYLLSNGYTVIPVNPGPKEILGLTCYPDLALIPVPVDMVDVFRKPEDVEPIAAEAVRIGAKCLWLQLGVINEAAIALADKAGLDIVVDRCVKIEHARLLD